MTSPYIEPPPEPEPEDDEVIVPDRGDGQPWTWGQHRSMEAALRELEESDPKVKEARERLDQFMIDGGFMDPPVPPVEVCKGCGQPVFAPHDEECEFRPLRPEEIVQREAHGYTYYDENMIPIHTSSVPCDDEEAIDYFRIVRAFKFDSEVHLRYVAKRNLGENDYKMIPWYYDAETGEVHPIVRSGS